MTEETKKEEKKEESKEEEKKEEGKEEVKTEEKKEEPKAEEKKEAAKKEEKKPEPTGKFKDLIKQIEDLSALELAELVKALEERFGVSVPTAIAAPTSATVGAPTESVGEEKATYTIHLADAGAQKIAVIKAIREIRQDLGLKEAKDLVDAVPKEVKADVPKEEAEEAKKKLEAAGAKVELK